MTKSEGKLSMRAMLAVLAVLLLNPSLFGLQPDESIEVEKVLLKLETSGAVEPEEWRPYIPWLVRALRSPDPMVVARAAMVIVNNLSQGIDMTELAPVLREKMHDPDPDVAGVAAFSVGLTVASGKRDLEEFGRILRRPDPKVRGNVLISLERMGVRAKELAPVIIDLLKNDPEPHVRMMAGRVLFMGARSDVAVPALVHAFEDPSPDVRAHAVRAFGSFGVKDDMNAVESLKKLLKDPNRQVRTQAALVLVRNGWDDKKIFPIFKEAFDRRGWEEREEIMAALSAAPRLSPRLAALLLRGVEDADWHVRMVALNGIAAHPKARKWPLPMLVRACRDRSSHVRSAAFEALASVQPPTEESIVSALKGGMQDQSHVVRHSALTAAGNMCSSCKELVPQIEALQRDPSRMVREEARKTVHGWRAPPDH
jgi:HEAT repeat protein